MRRLVYARCSGWAIPKPRNHFRHGSRHLLIDDVAATRSYSTTIAFQTRTTLLLYCRVRGNAWSSGKHLAHALTSRCNVAFLLKDTEQIVKFHQRDACGQVAHRVGQNEIALVDRAAA